MATGKSLKLRELGGVREAIDINPEMFINEDGTKKEIQRPLNRRERRARTTMFKRLIRKAKKQNGLKNTEGSTGQSTSAE